MAVMDVVGVVIVVDRVVSAPGAVLMVVLGVGDVALRPTLVPVAVMAAVGVPVVEVVGVVPVGHRHVAAITAVGVSVVLVGVVGGSRHCGNSLLLAVKTTKR